MALFLTEADRCGLRHTCGSDSRPLWNHINDHCKLVRGEMSFQRREGHQPSSVTDDRCHLPIQGLEGSSQPAVTDKKSAAHTYPAILLWLIWVLSILRGGFETLLSATHQEWAHFNVHTYWGHPSTLLPGWQGPQEMSWWRLSCWHVHPIRLSHLHTHEV